MTALDRLKQICIAASDKPYWERKDFELDVTPRVVLQLIAVVEAAVKWRDAPVGIDRYEAADALDAAIDAMRKEVGR